MCFLASSLYPRLLLSVALVAARCVTASLCSRARISNTFVLQKIKINKKHF